MKQASIAVSACTDVPTFRDTPVTLDPSGHDRFRPMFDNKPGVPGKLLGSAHLISDPEVTAAERVGLPGL